MRQAPHVISSYTAGARLIGLSDRQLEQELRRMQKAAKDQDSPYAKPLPFVHVRKKTKKKPAATKKELPESKPETQAEPKKSASIESLEHEDETLLIKGRARMRRKTHVYTDSDQEILVSVLNFNCCFDQGILITRKILGGGGGGGGGGVILFLCPA